MWLHRKATIRAIQCTEQKEEEEKKRQKKLKKKTHKKHTHTHTKKKKSKNKNKKTTAFTCQDHAGQQQQQQQMDCKLTGIHLIFFIDLGMICCSNDKSIDPVLCPLSSYCSRLNLYADEPKEFINMDP